MSSVRRGARCLRTRRSGRSECRPAVKNVNPILPSESRFNLLGKNKVHSLSSTTDVVLTQYPGIEVPQGQDGVPMFCTCNWLKIQESSKIAQLWGAVQDYETVEGTFDDHFHYYKGNDGELVNIFTNVGCLFLKPKIDEDSNGFVNITRIAAEGEPIKFGDNVIYIYCDGFEAKTGSTYMYEPINPRRIVCKPSEIDVKDLTVFFYHIDEVESTNGGKKAINVQILDDPYKFTLNDGESGENGNGKYEHKEQDTPEPPGPEPPTPEEDPFAPVYPEGSTDSEGHDISGTPIPNTHRIVNGDTNTDDFNEKVTIDGVEYSLKGAFPVTEYKLNENNDESIEYQEGKVIPVIKKYVFLYYIQVPSTEHENTESVYGTWVSILLGNNQEVGAHEAVMLYKPIEEYVAEDSDFAKAIKGVADETPATPAIYYYVNVLYHREEADVVTSIYRPQFMRYRALGVDAELKANIEYIYGNLHIFEEGALLCYEPLEGGKFRVKVLNIDEGASLINDGHLKCSDVLQNDVAEVEIA